MVESFTMPTYKAFDEFDLIFIASVVIKKNKTMCKTVITEKREKYANWVERVCDFISQVGPQLNLPVGAMQSNISEAIDNDINIMFLGHDPHEVPKKDYIFEDGDYIKDRFKEGNPCWGDRNTKWTIWKNLRDYFINVYGESSLMDDTKQMVFTNAVFFTGDNIKLVLDQIGTSVERKCLDFTNELIFDILHPKILVCFSVSDVFNKLIETINKKRGNILTVQRFKPYNIKHFCAITQYGGTIILGIPHPSGAHGIYSSLPAIVHIINDLSMGTEIENIVATKNLFLNPQEKNQYRISRIDKTEIVQQVISSINLDAYKERDKEKSQRYKLNEKYGITITDAGKGYIAIRHINYEHKGYENTQDAEVFKLKDILKGRRYNTSEKVWIGTKKFSQFGENDSEIIKAICKEIIELKEELQKM